MILAGPFGPKFMAEACVVSEKVGEGGLGEELRLLGVKEKVRKERERLEGMVVVRATDVMSYLYSILYECTTK